MSAYIFLLHFTFHGHCSVNRYGTEHPLMYTTMHVHYVGPKVPNEKEASRGTE